jgi:hypothetical protein
MKSSKLSHCIVGALTGSVMGFSFGSGFASIWGLILTIRVPLSWESRGELLVPGIEMGIKFAILGLAWGIGVNWPRSWRDLLYTSAAVGIIWGVLASTGHIIMPLLSIPMAMVSLTLRGAGLVGRLAGARRDKAYYLVSATVLLATFLTGLGLAWPMFSISSSELGTQALLATDQFAREQGWQGYKIGAPRIDSIDWEVSVTRSSGNVLTCKGVGGKIYSCEPDNTDNEIDSGRCPVPVSLSDLTQYVNPRSRGPWPTQPPRPATPHLAFAGCC